MVLLNDADEAVLPHWKDVLHSQGRSMVWLARETGRSPWTLYRYSTGDTPASKDFLERASTALGTKVRG